MYLGSQQVKCSDTSAESGSETEDIASPKAVRSFSQLRLTPVREEVFCSEDICSLIHQFGDFIFLYHFVLLILIINRQKLLG